MMIQSGVLVHICTIMYIIYIYTPPSSEVCKKSDPNEKNALAPWGAKKHVQGLNPFLIRIPCHLLLKCHFQRKYGPGCQTTKVNHFISSEFLCLGHPKSEPLHMNFFTWDTPQVNKFIWNSLLIFFGVWGTNLLGVQRVLLHIQTFGCFSVRSTVYLSWSSAKSTCLGL